MSLDSPAAVMARIDEILTDLANRENGFEAAVKELAREQWKWRRLNQTTLLTVQGRNKEEREARAETAVVAANADLYEQMIEHDAEVKATRAVVGLLEAQLSALQSVLRAQTREAYTTSPGRVAA